MANRSVSKKNLEKLKAYFAKQNDTEPNKKKNRGTVTKPRPNK